MNQIFHSFNSEQASEMYADALINKENKFSWFNFTQKSLLESDYCSNALDYLKDYLPEKSTYLSIPGCGYEIGKLYSYREAIAFLLVDFDNTSNNDLRKATLFPFLYNADLHYCIDCVRFPFNEEIILTMKLKRHQKIASIPMSINSFFTNLIFFYKDYIDQQRSLLALNKSNENIEDVNISIMIENDYPPNSWMKPSDE